MRLLWLSLVCGACSFDTSGGASDPADADPNAVIDSAAIDGAAIDGAAIDATVSDAAPGAVSHQESQSGGSTGMDSVSVTVSAGTNATWLAAVATRDFQEVDSVDGMGATWTRVVSQCSAENKTGVDLWTTSGTFPGGEVSSQLGQTATAAVIAVTRYDNVSGLGTISTENLNPACNSAANESNSYSFVTDPAGATGIVYVATGHREKAHTPGAGLVERIENHASSSATVGLSISDGPIAGADALIVNGTFSGSDDWAVVAVELQP